MRTGPDKLSSTSAASDTASSAQRGCCEIEPDRQYDNVTRKACEELAAGRPYTWQPGDCSKMKAT